MALPIPPPPPGGGSSGMVTSAQFDDLIKIQKAALTKFGTDNNIEVIIDRETGVMVTQNYVDQDKKYYALCNKIEENSLPIKKTKQKF